MQHTVSSIDPVDVAVALAPFAGRVTDDRLWASAVQAAATALELAAGGVDVIAAPVVGMPA